MLYARAYCCIAHNVHQTTKKPTVVFRGDGSRIIMVVQREAKLGNKNATVDYDVLCCCVLSRTSYLFALDASIKEFTTIEL